MFPLAPVWFIPPSFCHLKAIGGLGVVAIDILQNFIWMETFGKHLFAPGLCHSASGIWDSVTRLSMTVLCSACGWWAPPCMVTPKSAFPWGCIFDHGEQSCSEPTWSDHCMDPTPFLLGKQQKVAWLGHTEGVCITWQTASFANGLCSTFPRVINFVRCTSSSKLGMVLLFFFLLFFFFLVILVSA